MGLIAGGGREVASGLFELFRFDRCNLAKPFLFFLD
jgi:hypothetical protein